MSHINDPVILEIGVDYGQSTLPLVHNLISSCDRFLYTGVDIKLRQEVIEQAVQMNDVLLLGKPGVPKDSANVVFYTANSLELLPKLKSHGAKYDLILIDGDHNYFTVKNELDHIKDIVYPSTIIMCDDYNGRCAESDMFYSDRKEYESIEIATPRKHTEKQGVRTAVSDFLSENPTWAILDHGLDPCFLFQKDYVDFNIFSPEGSTSLSDCILEFNLKSPSALARFKESTIASIME